MKTKFNISRNYWPFNIEKVEKKYNAKYIGDFCIKLTNGGWSEEPIAIFYVEHPDASKGYSNYFGMFQKLEMDENNNYVHKGVYITKGDSAFEEPLTGIEADDGEIVISCYRHDYRESTDGSVMIDGGRDYLRHRGDSSKLVKVGINKHELYVIRE